MRRDKKQYKRRETIIEKGISFRLVGLNIVKFNLIQEYTYILYYNGCQGRAYKSFMTQTARAGSQDTCNPKVGVVS
jgi:hypothetical protein